MAIRPGPAAKQLAAVTIVLEFRAFQFAKAENFFTGHFGGGELDEYRLRRRPF